MSERILAAIDEEMRELQQRIGELADLKDQVQATGQTPPGKRRAMKGQKSTRRKASKSEGEQRPRKGKADGARAVAADRKATALQLLAAGKTPKEVAQHLGVSEASIYLYRKHAR